MALVVYDRVQETTSTTGTGTITLGGAVSGYQSFAVVGNGNTTFYCIVNGSAWEVGIGTYSTTGPTLARTTVLSNSSGTTSPITLSGASNVFVTYPSEKSVNLDASGNVSALGTISSGTWQGSTVGVSYGGTGVTSSSGANSVVLRDASQNITFNNYVAGFAATTAAAGTTTLTVASARNQVLVGSTTQTYVLPNATTLQLGQSFVFINNSSGALTVKDNSGATIETVPSGGVTQLGATSISTSAGSWGAYSFIPAAVDWGTNDLNLASTVISGGTWQGGTIASGYGGTGLTTFTAANYALYSTSASALTAGTLPVPAGGTGQTSFTSGYIPYGNTTAALQSSSLLQFNGTYLQVGGGSVLGGATNPITAFSQSANNYVQTYVYNPSTGTSASSDFVAYTNNSTDAHGWADMGFTSSTYADATYTCTGPNEAYLFGSALNSSYTGNLVYATDSTGSANAHQWYVGGFTQAKSAWKMQLTSTGLQLANALAVSSGGTGVTTSTGSGDNVLSIRPTMSVTGSGFTLQDATDTTKTANFVLSGLTTGTNYTYTLPAQSGSTLAVLGLAQTWTAAQTITGTLFATGTAGSNNSFGTSATTGTQVIGGTSQTGTLTVGQSTVSQTTNIQAGATASGSTKTINIGTGGLAGSTTAIAIGSTTGTSTTTLNGTLSLQNALPIAQGGTGSTTAATVAGTGISVSGTFPNQTVTNAGVTSAVAGTGISVSGATGAVTITNSGVTSIVAGTGISVSGATGAVTVSSTASGATITGTTTSGTYYVVGTTSTSGSLSTASISNTNVVSYNASTGALSAVSHVSSSDERLKTNWVNLSTDFVSGLADVKHGTFERISSGNREVGVTAQSLKEVLPEAVIEGEDGMLSVNYGAAALVAAIELAKEVKALRAEIAALKAK